MGTQADFNTPRLRAHLENEQQPSFAGTLSHIRKFGHEVITVTADGQGTGWAYTIGNFDTRSQPEFITVGLPDGVGHASLNVAVELAASGIDLTHGRHPGLLGGEIGCYFIPVAKRWMQRLMHRSDWYYEEENYPVLQMVYPDLANRFAGEEGFDSTFAQPMLSEDAPWTCLEDDFWKANDPEAPASTWKFPNSRHSTAYVSRKVHATEESVIFVSHDRDGDWQFLGDTMTDSGGVIECLHHQVDKDSSLEELADLPLGWYAEREVLGAPWQRYELPPDEEN